MKVNLSQWDAAARLALGFIFSVWAAAGGPWWSWIGIYLIFTASYRICAFYLFINFSTATEEKRELE